MTAEEEEEETPAEDTKTTSSRERLVSWLVAEGWQVTDAPAPGAAWRVRCEDAGGRRLAVGQKEGRTDVIVLQAALSLSPQHSEAVGALDSTVRENLLWDLRFFLLQLSVDFAGIEHPLRHVTLNAHLYVEELTQNEFSQQVLRLRNGLLAVVWMLNRHLREPPASVTASTDVN